MFSGVWHDIDGLIMVAVLLFLERCFWTGAGVKRVI